MKSECARGGGVADVQPGEMKQHRVPGHAGVGGSVGKCMEDVGQSVESLRMGGVGDADEQLNKVQRHHVPGHAGVGEV